jgi:hypothetical protein
MSETTSPIDVAVIDLMHHVQAAQEQEITDRARATIDRDNQLEELASYPSILGHEALALGERMLFLARHRSITRWAGRHMIEIPQQRVVIHLASPGERDAEKHRQQALKYFNDSDRAKYTELRTPLLFASEAEHIEGLNGTAGTDIVHGWYFRLWAYGGKGIKQHRPRQVSIIDRYEDKNTDIGQDVCAFTISLKDDDVQRAKLYIKYPPFGPFPAEHQLDRHDEDYILPIGLLREAQQLLGTKKLSAKVPPKMIK